MSFFNSPVTPTSSPGHSPWKKERSWDPALEHNYAAKPPDIQLTVHHPPKRPLTDQLQNDDTIKGKSQVIMEQSNQLEKCRVEIAKKNSQLAEAAGIMISYQRVQKKLAIAEEEIENQKLIVEQERSHKADLQLKFEKFRNTATNVCCGITVFIDEFKRQFKSWCITNQVQENDQIWLQEGLECVSDYVQDKLRVWLEEAFLTQADLEKAKTSVQQFAHISQPFLREQENKISNSSSVVQLSAEEEVKIITANSSPPQQPSVTEEVDEEATSTCDLKKLPDETEEKVMEDGEVNVKKETQLDSPILRENIKHMLVEDEDKKGFLCSCGVKCKSISGLKLHIRNLLKPLSSRKKKSDPVTRITARDIVTVKTKVVLSESDADKEDDILMLDVKPSTSQSSSIKQQKLSSTPCLPPKRTRMSALALSVTSTTSTSLSSSSEPKRSSPVHDNENEKCLKSLQEVKNATPVVVDEIIKSKSTSKSSEINSKKNGKRVMSRSCHKVHPTRPLECNCGYKATHMYILTRHVKYYMSDRKYACKICPRLFVNSNYLKYHYRDVHKIRHPVTEVEILKYKESISKSSTDKTENSKPIPTADAFIRARIMSKKRRSATKRKRKLLRITAKERIPCQYCYRRFPHIRDLIMHMARRRHGGEGLVSRIRSKADKKKMTTPKKNVGANINGPTISSVTLPAVDLSKVTPRRSTRIHTELSTKSTMSLYYHHSKQRNKQKPEVKAQGQQRCECDRNCGEKNGKPGVSPLCHICGNIFVCVLHLKTHVLEKHNVLCKIPKVCNGCGADFHTTEELDKHSKSECCKVPPSSPSVSVDENENVKIKKEIPLASTRPCTRHRSSSSSRQKEEPKPKEEKKEKIKIEDQGQTHYQVKVRGRNAASTFKCSCGKYYSSQRSLHKHMQEQRMGRIFKCDNCDLRFAKYCNLKVHARRMHRVDLSKMYGCGQCGKVFNSNAERIRHKAKDHRNGVPGENTRVLRNR